MNAVIYFQLALSSARWIVTHHTAQQDFASAIQSPTANHQKRMITRPGIEFIGVTPQWSLKPKEATNKFFGFVQRIALSQQKVTLSLLLPLNPPDSRISSGTAVVGETATLLNEQPSRSSITSLAILHLFSGNGFPPLNLQSRGGCSRGWKIPTVTER